MATNFILAHLHQTATYWAPGGSDGFGGVNFSAPIQIKCRWEERSELFTNAAGREDRSIARVFPDRALKNGGYLLLGTSTTSSPTGVAGAYEIKDVRAIPNLTNQFTERRVFL
jgi:hypothetical protein